MGLTACSGLLWGWYNTLFLSCFRVWGVFGGKLCWCVDCVFGWSARFVVFGLPVAVVFRRVGFCFGLLISCLFLVLWCGLPCLGCFVGLVVPGFWLGWPGCLSGWWWIFLGFACLFGFTVGLV